MTTMGQAGLKTALPGIVTGLLAATAIAVGETAPLLTTGRVVISISRRNAE